MNKIVYIEVATAVGLLASGYLVIRLLGWGLPPSRTFKEFLLRVFWIYPETIDRARVRRNKLAWLVVVVVAYVITNMIFF